MDYIIRPAQIYENEILTNIAFAAKRHWNYPGAYYKIWEKELTITKDYIEQNTVYNLVRKDEVVGFYSIIENSHNLWLGNIFIEKGFWLEHLFILPSNHGLGLGRILMHHALEVAKSLGIGNLKIFVDPYAIGFYHKMGAVFLREAPSSIEGRMIPVYEINIEIGTDKPTL